MKFQETVALICLGGLVASNCVALDAGTETSVYVWHFATRAGESTELTSSLTEEFEEALVNASCVTVKQNRLFGRLFHQRGVAGLAHVDPTDREALGGIAEIVVFGEVYRDDESQQTRVGISVENIATMEILGKRSESERIVRMSDADSRNELVARLAPEVCAMLGSAAKPAGEMIDFTEFDQGAIVSVAGDCNVIVPTRAGSAATSASASACTLSVSQGVLTPPYAVELAVSMTSSAKYRLALRDASGKETAVVNVEGSRYSSGRFALLSYGDYGTKIERPYPGLLRLEVREGRARLFSDGRFLTLQPVSAEPLGSVVLSGVARDHVFVHRLGATEVSPGS